jgi:hypothetical protein
MFSGLAADLRVIECFYFSSPTICLNYLLLPFLGAGLLFLFRLSTLCLLVLPSLLVDERPDTDFCRPDVFEILGLPFSRGRFGFDFFSSTPDESFSKL